MRLCKAIFCVLLISLFSSLAPALADGNIQYVDANDTTGCSAAVVVGDAPRAITTQLLPLDQDGEIVGKANADAQIQKVLADLEAVLKTADSGFDKILRLHVCLANDEIVKNATEALARTFTGKAKPAVTFVVGNLTHFDALVAMDAVAVSSLRDPTGAVRHFSADGVYHKTATAHVAILPPGPVFYLSGQPTPGKDMGPAAEKTLKTLQETLAFLKLSNLNVVQLKVFMGPIAQAALVEQEVIKAFAPQASPPIVFVEWIAGIPIEIELIAAAPQAPVDADTVTFLTPPGVKASPVYSRIANVSRGKTIYISGLYGTTPDDGAAQIHEIFATLKKLLAKTGSDLEHMAKATYYCCTDDASRKLNEIRPQYYSPKRPPAASKAMVRGVGKPGSGITIDMIAVARK